MTSLDDIMTSSDVVMVILFIVSQFNPLKT